MSEHEIREQLQQLSDALEGLDVDPASKAKLNALVDELESQLQSPVTEDSSVPQQLDELVAAFETDHPTLAGILNRIMVTLSSMGV